MNRESGPSFSLGVSQLECFKESQEVVNFVPGDFNYKIDDFHENRSKHRNNPQSMKKLRQSFAKKDKKKEVVLRKEDTTVLKVKPLSREEELLKKFVEMSFLRVVALSCVIKEISSHPLRYIEQPNQEEIHIFVKGRILRFFINEFALITGLNCFGNVDDFKYEDSSPSRLMKMYFPQSTNGVDKEALVECFLKGSFENKEESLQMAILYSIHTFIYSQLNASPVLMASLRQEFSMEKQLYRLGGIPQIDQKFKDLERLMNARFTEVLNSLEQKNETVKQDAGIEKQSDIAVEEIQPLGSIIPGREHDLTLTIYKSPPTTLAESSSKEKKKLASKEQKKFSFESYHIAGDSPTIEMEIFEEWIHDGFYKQHAKKYTTTDYFFKVYIDKAYVNYYNSNVAKDLATQDAFARTDEVADMKKSLINTIKGLSTCAGQPWHIVNERKSKRDPFLVEYVSEIAQQDSESLDCGVFVVVYAEYLSEELGILC
ncbi:hypothetical protein BC332_27978 [Capsicum chinense]|nr:hypothetical protein BC332_27978 [Capsicum chinense]